MNEQQPTGRPPEEPKREQPLDEDERVGDVSEKEVGDDGHTERSELRVPPRIWVGSLLDYNHSVLHGDWIDAARNADQLEEAIRTVLDRSPWTARTGERVEEWGIFDYEGFGPLRLDQHEDLSWVMAVAKGIVAHGQAFAAWADIVEDESALDSFTDAYLGHHDSVTAYAQQLIEDLGYEQLLDQAIPDNLRAYVRIDTDALGRDLVLGGDVYVIDADEGGIWLFSTR